MYWTKMTTLPCSQSVEVGIFFDVHGLAWAFTGSLSVQPRKISDCDLLQMTRDTFAAVAERPSNGIHYLCVRCDIYSNLE